MNNQSFGNIRKNYNCIIHDFNVEIEGGDYNVVIGENEQGIYYYLCDIPITCYMPDMDNIKENANILVNAGVKESVAVSLAEAISYVNQEQDNYLER